MAAQILTGRRAHLILNGQTIPMYGHACSCRGRHLSGYGTDTIYLRQRLFHLLHNLLEHHDV